MGDNSPPATNLAMKPRVTITVDFKRSEAYLLLHPDGPAHSTAADYDAEVAIAEWESQPDLAPPVERTPITVKTHAHKVAHYERMRMLQGLPAAAGVFGADARGTKALLAGLRVMRMARGDAHADVLFYVGVAFAAYANASVDVESTALVAKLVARASPGIGVLEDIEKRISAVLDQTKGQLIRATDVLQSSGIAPSPHLFVPAFFVGTVCSFDFHGLSMARLQLEAKGAKSRRPDVVPDVPILWSDIGRSVSPRAPGMPLGPPASIITAAYRKNSPLPPSHTSAIIDLYLDIKSPHAFLGVEMARQLESDFDVRLRVLPFDMDIKAIHGEDRLPDAKFTSSATAEPPKRTEAQRARVKTGYADIRNLGKLQGLTIYGQEKVWDSRLVNLAILFALQQGGRAAQDKVVDEAFERTWKRDLDLESVDAITDILSRALPTDSNLSASFRAYIQPNGAGNELLRRTLEVAAVRGVWGIPSFYLDGEMYWGKEQVPLLRKRLMETGRALRADVELDVPYLWRPPRETQKKAGL